MNVYEVINQQRYDELKQKGFRAIPTMNIFTVKPDEHGKPYRAKSRIVVLGNLEQRLWSNSERYAPVLQSSSCQLLTSMAVEHGRILIQGDCKNAFCQPSLPDDEVVVCTPPAGCPRSAPNTYWLLKKTLYGLRRSPHHWFERFVEVLVKQMGFTQCANDPCMLEGTPIKGEPPIYIGIYVDDFIYFSKSDAVEKWFERTLKEHVKVEFMGSVSYFLGSRYVWYHTENGLAVHVSQPGFSELLLERFGMSDANPVKTPYRSGLVID